MTYGLGKNIFLKECEVMTTMKYKSISHTLMNTIILLNVHLHRYNIVLGCINLRLCLIIDRYILRLYVD